MRCATVATPTAWNEHQIETMIALGDELGAPCGSRARGPRSNGDTAPLSIQPSRATWDRIETLMAERKESIAVGPECPASEAAPDADAEEMASCRVGLAGVIVDPFGNVKPCMHIREVAGNLPSAVHCGDLGPVAPVRAGQAARHRRGVQMERGTTPAIWRAIFCLAIDEMCGEVDGRRVGP